MGKRVDEQTGPVGGEANATAATGKKAGTGDTSTKRTAGTGTGGGTGGGRTGTEESKQGENVPGLVSVNVPGKEKADSQEEPPKKKGPGRPKGSGTKTKKQTPAKTKAAIPGVDENQITVIMLTVSSIVASRPGMEIWQLTEAEVKQLAEPINRMVQRSALMSKVNETNADAIALIVAAFTIFIPKFIIWNATRPKKKKKEGEKITYDKPGRTKQQQPAGGNETGKADKDNRNQSGQNSAASETVSTNVRGGLFETMPPVAGF